MFLDLKTSCERIYRKDEQLNTWLSCDCFWSLDCHKTYVGFSYFEYINNHYLTIAITLKCQQCVGDTY